MSSFRLLVAVTMFGVISMAGAVAEAEASRSPPPAKAVKQAEAKLRRLMKDGEDRPSVYAARMELAKALRAVQSCDNHDRIDQELAAVAAWLERIEIPVQVSTQLVFNEIGRAAQARAECTEEPKSRRAYHEAALRAFERARVAARDDHDALNEAITLFNASASAEALGDPRQAIALMEEACAIDREYALHENYREDYQALTRLKAESGGTPASAEAVEQHLASLREEKVRFSFKPAHGEQQRYRSEMHQIILAEGRRQERQLELQYAGVVTVKDDLVTVTIKPSESSVGGRPAKAVPATTGVTTAEDLVARLLAQPLSYTVKTSGEYVGATGIEDVRRIVLARIDEAFSAPAASEQRARAHQLVERLLSDAVVNQQIAGDWTMAVGWWIDAELDLGDWYTLDVDTPQAALPNSTVKYTYFFKVSRRIACGPWDRSKSCVELIIEGRPDREQFADYLIAFMKEAVGRQPRKQVRWFRERLVEDVELVERHVLVVDPDTLKTYRQLKSRTTYVSPPEPGGHPKIERRIVQAELQSPAQETRRSRVTAKKGRPASTN